MSQAEAQDYEAPETANPPKGVMATLFVIVLMDLFGFGLIIPLLPFYAVEYNASPIQVGILFSLYSLCQLIASPILGLISDRYGRRPVLILSQIGSVSGYALLGVVTAMEWHNAGMALMLIYLSRIIDGISAGNISTAQAYISDVTSEENRSKGMGMLGAAFGIGFALGPALGGIVTYFGHSTPAFLAAIFSFGAVVMTYYKLPESHVHKPTQDAEVLLHPSKLAFLSRRPALLQLIGIFFISMAAFVMMESCVALFLKRPDTFNFGPFRVGMVFALAGVVIVIVQGGLIGRLTKRLGEWPLAIAGPALVALAMGLYVWMGYTPSIWLLVIATVLNAGGRSLQGPSLSSLVSKFAPRDEQGAAFGAYHSVGSLARVLGPLVGNAFYENHITGPFLLASALTLVACAWSVMLAARSPAIEAASPLAQPVS